MHLNFPGDQPYAATCAGQCRDVLSGKADHDRPDATGAAGEGRKALLCWAAAGAGSGLPARDVHGPNDIIARFPGPQLSGPVMKRKRRIVLRPFQFADVAVLRRWLAGMVIVIMVIVIAVLVLDLRQQMQRLASSAADNMQWTIGQAEIEILALETAALRAEQGKVGLAEVRLRYDIFYSRIAIPTESQRLQDLFRFGATPERLAKMTRFRDVWLPVIDGPDPELWAALPQLADEANALRQTARDIALAAVAHFSEAGDIQRKSLGSSLLRIGLLTVALVSLLAVLGLALYRLARKSDAVATVNRETRERIETILSASLDAIIVSDAQGRILDFNGAAERIFGHSRADALGADMADLIIPDQYRAAHRKGMQHFHENRQHRFLSKGIVQLDAQRQDGTVFPVDLSLAQAQSPNGVMFIAFMRDISDRVRGEVALKQARDRAIAGEKQKADLLAVMSHEMRTPLNGMLGTLDLIDEGGLDSENRRYLKIFRASAHILRGHVDDVLDISRLDAGKLNLRRVRFDLISLLEEIIDNQRQRARIRGNVIVLSPPDPALHEVYSDPDRLRQILLNLLGNAIKFTRNGRITLEVDCSEGLDAVEIRVTDTGIGISGDDLGRIFDDFVTIDSSYARSTSGTGLGLGISQRLAAALGGDLGAESEPGDGSLFWLRLPLAPPARHIPQPVEDRQEPAAWTGPPLDILLVEDNMVNRIVARDLLERDGHRVGTAVDGESALKIAGRSRYDAILMDISMPGMDGLTLARALRAGHGVNAQTPIIATTAHALPQEVQAFRAAGMRTVLLKPLGVQSLRAALAEALAEPNADPTPNAPHDTELPLIDAAHLREMRHELSHTRFQQARATFEHEMSAFMSALPTQISGDPATLADLAAEAHRMAGSAGVIGAHRLIENLRDIQVAARASDHARLRQGVDPLQQCWAATLMAFEGSAPIVPSGH